MLQSFFSILPIIALVAAGFLIGRAVRKPSDELSDHYLLLDRFIFYVLAPAFFFFSMAKGNPDAFINLPYFLALIASQFIMMGVALVIAGNFFKEPFGERMLHSLSSSFPNILFLGFPVLLVVFGEQGMLPAIQAVFIQQAVIMPLLLSTLQFDLAVRRGFSHGNRQTTVIEIIRAGLSVVKNPIVLSVAAGVVFSYFNVDMPSALTNFFNLASGALNVVALFAIGVFMAQSKFIYKLSVVQESWWVVILKIIVMPLLAWVIVTLVFPYLDSMHAAVVVIIAALPSAGSIMLLAQRFGIRKKRTMLEYHLTTLASAVTLSIILAYYLS
ncbi:MAG: AEC family transporter [Hydrotalea sp.]|nr:AEC family transporter [Hydrotalea sp.]